MVSTLQLPRLPVGGWTDLQFQVWWQEVVERIEASVNSLNDTVEALVAAQTSIAQLEMNSAVISTQMGNVSRSIGALADQIAAIEGMLGARQADSRKQALALQNMELMQWQS